ncbi:Uncharacterized protein SCF082_LOCUS2000, partial [Durusdinium trenchii]
VINQLSSEAVRKHMDSLGSESWLASQQDDVGVFTVGCAVCSHALPNCDLDIWGRFEVKTLEGFKPYRMQAHAQSSAHVAAVLRLLEGSLQVSQKQPLRLEGAPDAEAFRTLLAYIRKGGALRNGVEGVGHFQKSRRMCFALAEALRRLYRSWLAEAETINLLRDERHSRLLVRFQCATLGAKRFIGVVGQGKVHPGTATRITEVTVDLLRNLCTKNHGAPNADPSVAELDSELLQRIRHHIHSLTADAAENEVASGFNMQSGKSSTATIFGEAVAPSLRTIVRDKAHGSRRILERPWAADVYLSTIAGVLVSESGSLAQRIQTSDPLRVIYEQCCKASTSKAVSTNFSHLRAAKHRYESLTSPLARMTLDWGAVVAFLLRVEVERQGTPAGAFARSLLQTLDEEMLLQAALLADACDECLILIRFFDQSTVDNAQIASAISDFLSRLAFLFKEQHIWTTSGYTLATLSFLESPTHFVVDGVVRCIGGPNGVSKEIRSQCLSRMLAWANLAEEVVRAEHPSFELVQCFSIFDMPNFPKQTASEIQKQGCSQRFDEQLTRLAWSLLDMEDMSQLKDEYFDLGQIAYAHWLASGKTASNLECWQVALGKTSSTAARMRHPAEHLQIALAHYATISATDSVIERNFSKVKDVLRENRLQCEALVENELVMLAVSDPSHDQEVISISRTVWSELYADSRKRCKPRFDKGVTRQKLARQLGGDDDAGAMTPEKVTETEFKKRRRHAVSAALLQGETADASMKVAACPSNAWTDAHDKEMQFNAKKQLKRVFECLRSGTIQIHELPAELVPEAIQFFENQTSLMEKREKAEQRVAQRVCQRAPRPEELEGLKVFVDDALRTRELDRAMDAKNWDTVMDIASAQVFMLSDLSKMPLVHSIAAGLTGAWLTTPGFVIAGKGPCLKLKRGLRTDRKVHCALKFRAEYPEVFQLLQRLQCRTFKLLETLEEFAVAKQLACDRKAPAGTIALVHASERVVFQDIAHAFEAETFRDFIYMMDTEKSSCQG